MAFEKLLVALDGSDHSDRATELAADIAAHYASEVVLVHVVHDPRGIVPKGLEEYERIEHTHITERDLLRSAGRWIVTEAEKRLRKHGVDAFTSRIDFGHPASSIVEFASDHLARTDAIVMGRRGLGGVTGLVLGSVSHRVLHLASCAVITVE